MKTKLISVTVALILVIALAAWIGHERNRPVYVLAADSTTSPHLLIAGASQGADPSVLLPGFAAESDVESSFKGDKLIFAGKRSAADRWQIWECDLGGANVVQRAIVDADCDEPHYLPDGSIVFRKSTAGGSVLCSVKDNPKKAEQITFNREPISNTVILPDGRIYANLGTSKVTINADGTGVALFTGDDADVAAARAAVAAALNPVRPRQIVTGHVSVIDPKKRPGGLLFCLNTYLSDTPGIDALPDGAISRARIWVADPQPRVAAEAPIQADGSFFLQTPANVPMRFQALDSHGRVLGDQTTWIWLRANETRGCIGCHESPELSPENIVAMATRKPPVIITAAAPNAAVKVASAIQGVR